MRLLSSPAVSGLSVIVAWALSLSPLHAQSAGQSDWNMDCDNAGCRLAVTATDARTEQRIATILILVEKERQSPLLAAIVPLGVAIEPGLRFLYGDEVLSLSVEACFPDGCRAVIETDETFLAALTAAEEFEIRYFPLGSEQPVAITLPSGGLSDILEEARKALEE